MTIDEQTTYINEQTQFFEQEALFDFLEVPLLLLDTDPERAVQRQKELMDTVFDGIGQESKAEKRLGLALQQLDVEQRHALRLLLIYRDAPDLITHLRRCLAEPTYGYGQRGDNGRTIAQAMAALAEDIEPVVAGWFEAHQPFRQQVFSGIPFSFRSLFDDADLDSFVPVVQRRDETTWRLGVEGEGKYRDFQGVMAEVWPHLCDTYVAWSEQDNDVWLNQVKRQAGRLPDTIQRAAWADRLRKDIHRVELQDGRRVGLHRERKERDWPQLVVLGDQIGLNRLSGHAFYEVAWGGGLFSRRFEMSSSSRNGIPFDHTELALRLAESLGAEAGLQPEAANPAEVEAAYLRRLQAREARLGPAAVRLPDGVRGTAVAAYTVGTISATLLHGDDDVAYVSQEDAATGVLLYRDRRREVLAAVSGRQGRFQRGRPLMTTPLAELDQGWNRALAAWGCWLASVVN